MSLPRSAGKKLGVDISDRAQLSVFLTELLEREVQRCDQLSDEEFYAREFTQKPVDLTCPEHGVNAPWLPSKTREMWRRGYSDQEIFDLLYSATRGVQHRVITEAEIQRAIALVIGTSVDSLQINGRGSPRSKATFDPEYLAQVAARITEPVDEAYLEARSQFSCWNRSPVGFFHKIFQLGQKVWVTNNTKSDDGEIWTHVGSAQRFDELDHLVTGCQGVWYLTNPIDGELHALERIKKERNPDGLTFIALECVNAWPHMMFETDVAPAELWRKAIVQMPLPIVAVYNSGGLSDHVLVRLDARSKQHWETLCGQYDDNLIRLGACPGSLTARRLSRLPNCMREEKGRLQQLLYLTPDADGTPICQRPVRPPAPTYLIHNYESPDL